MIVPGRCLFVNKPVVVFLAVLTVSLLGGCHYHVPALPDKAEFVPASEEEQNLIIERLKESSRQIKTMRARLSGRVEQGIAEEKFTQVLVFEQPDKLRLAFFIPGVNQLTGIMITRAGSLHAVDPMEMKVFRGTATRENIEGLLSVPFMPREAMNWFVGRFNVPEEEELLQSEVLIRNDKQRAMASFVVDSGQTITLVLILDEEVLSSAEDDPIKQQLLIELMEIKGGDQGQLLFSKYFYPEEEASEKLIAPSQIQFWLPKHDISGEFTYKEQQLNPKFGYQREKLFLGRTPAGSTLIDLDRTSADDIDPLF